MRSTQNQKPTSEEEEVEGDEIEDEDGRQAANHQEALSAVMTIVRRHDLLDTLGQQVRHGLLPV